MKWTDISDLAYALYLKHPGVDPLKVNFPDLRAMVVALPEFDDDPKLSNEAKLEAIQMAWIEEIELDGDARSKDED